VRELAAFDLVALLGTLALPLASPVLIKGLGYNPLDYSPAGLLRIRVVVLVLVGISAVVGMWWRRKVWLIAAGIYYSIFLSLYTTLFTNGRGVESGFVGMLGYWISQQDVARGGQPWYYYFFLLLVYEFLPLLLAVLGAVYYLLTRRTKGESSASAETEVPLAVSAAVTFVPFVLYWVLLNFVIFTWSGEKMPWQNQHLVLPLSWVGCGTRPTGVNCCGAV